MENINLLYVLQPLVVIIIASALMIYWFRKRHFRLTVLVFSLAAYAGAIGLKYAVQIPTIGFIAPSGSYALGVYYGLQTMFFEVGLAFLIAWLAIKYGELKGKDAEGYGSGLAFWENAGLLGILPLINYVAYYSILSSNTPLAQTLYDQLITAAPQLFTTAPQALSLVALGILERFSSIIIHFAWGYLCFMAVLHRRKRLFLIALPMGFVDFFVPFAQSSYVIAEGVFLGIALLSLIVAWSFTRDLRDKANKEAIG